MKKFFKSVAVLCMAATVSSCGTMLQNSSNSNTTLTNVELTHANYRVVKNVEGFASASYVFGIGGLSRKSVRDNAIADMMRKANMTGSQTIVNVQLKNHFASVLGLYIRISYSATAQVIEFLPEGAAPQPKHQPGPVAGNQHYDVSKPATPAAPQYNIGELYDDGKIKGYIFELSDDGQHGKIVYHKIVDHVQWCSNETKQNIAETLNIMDGEKNMQIIRAIPDWQNKYPAFAACAKLGAGWYLPSTNEVLLIQTTLPRKIKKEIIASDVWTSTMPKANSKTVQTLYSSASVTGKRDVIAVAKF